MPDRRVLANQHHTTNVRKKDWRFWILSGFHPDFHMVGAESGPRKTPAECDGFISVAIATIAVYIKTQPIECAFPWR